MGNSVCSSRSHGSVVPNASNRRKTIWRENIPIEEQKKMYIEEGSLPADAKDEWCQLRSLLSEPLGQKYLGDYAKSILTQESFFCWVDIQEVSQGEGS